MKAIVYTKYGPPEVLQLKEVEKPSPKDHEILIKVKATAVNSGDWRLRKADPPLVRLFFGLFRPSKKILGYIVSGEVVATGNKVKKFKTGDQVFGATGMRFGAYAEFVCLPEKATLITRPPGIPDREAAALPFGGITALHFLNKAKINKGQKVLVYGASGSTGTAAVQLAKYYGAEVTGVCSDENMGLVSSLGADRVINYREEDYTKSGNKYDIIFDAVGKTTKSRSKAVLSSGGKYVTVNNGLARTNIEGLELLATLAVSGKFKAVIDRTYPLEEMAEAHRYAEQGHKKGNVVITLD